MKVFAKRENIGASAQKIFELTSNCNHLGTFLPEQVKDWESTENYCKFTIPGITTLTLTIEDKKPFAKVLYRASNDKDIPISITFLMEETASATAHLTVEADVDVPIFIQPMVKSPLQNLVDLIANKVQQVAENE